MKTSAKLLNLHLAIKQAFNIEQEHVYIPHMSLLYSNMNMAERESVMQSVTIASTSTMARTISIVHADSPDPNTWKELSSIQL